MFICCRWASLLVRWTFAASLAEVMPATASVPCTVPMSSAVTAGRVGQIDTSLSAAARFLIGAQSSDGAWRSQVYGCFRDGPTLTPYVMSSLFFLPQGGMDAREAFRRGADYLTGMVDPDGRIRTGPQGLVFPAYTAAMASRVVVLQDRTLAHFQAQTAWLNYLRQRRLGQDLGWARSDPEFGGWGFSLGVPRKPASGAAKGLFIESNLSVTLFGIAALKSAKVPESDPIYEEILVFVRRCQNFSEDPNTADPRFDDGGFFFMPGDLLQNKAGVAGTDRNGNLRFHSYGTMTADGLRAMVQCGVPPSHPRVVAARRWLENHFSVSSNPGAFNDDREVLRNATYYYYCWALAHTFMHLGTRDGEAEHGKTDWAGALAEELMKRQQPDGTWVNRFTDAKEDDPLISTPWAAAALAICRRVLTGDHQTLTTHTGAGQRNGATAEQTRRGSQTPHSAAALRHHYPSTTN